jgi:hypothetical protein
MESELAINQYQNAYELVEYSSLMGKLLQTTMNTKITAVYIVLGFPG